MNLLLGNRKEKDILIVDSRVQGFAYKITNGIYIPPYEGPPTDKNPHMDNYFADLYDYLKDFNDVFDVRPKIERDFHLKDLFKKNFKNPAMEKLKSLKNSEKEKEREKQTAMK